MEINTFRNHFFSQIDFTEQFVAICGENGSGKTSILEAIASLCFGKSYFSTKDALNIQKEHAVYFLRAKFGNEEIGEVQLGYGQKEGKRLKLNQVPIQKLSEYFGTIPIICFAPEDTAIASGGPGERRKFMDRLISQISPQYKTALFAYHKLIAQRNALLRQEHADPVVFDSIEYQMEMHSKVITEERSQFFEEFKLQWKQILEQWVPENEKFDVQEKFYSASAEDWKRNRVRDSIVGYTTSGVHKDDLVFHLNTMQLKDVGSQGQKKSAVIAAILASIRILSKYSKYKPLVLLDDIFDKFDIKRTTQLVKEISKEQIGTLFLTDTDADRIHQVFESSEVPFQLIQCENGQIKA